MRWLVALACLTAVAGAEPWTEPDPAAVVGRWTGAVTWTGCAIDGARQVTFAVSRDGSGYRIDLAPLADGLGAEILVAIGGPRLAIDRADRHGVWTMGKPGRARLELGLGAACQASASLRRASIGSPACDEEVALRDLRATCAALADAPPLASLPIRPRAAACQRALAPLRRELVGVGCLPSPIPVGATRIAACDQVLAIVTRAARCDRISVEMKQRLGEQARIVARSAAIDDPAARADLSDSCRTTATELGELLELLHCPAR